MLTGAHKGGNVREVRVYGGLLFLKLTTLGMSGICQIVVGPLHIRWGGARFEQLYLCKTAVS